MTKEDKQALRDLFASQALIGLTRYGKKYSYEEMALISYGIADAMLKVREKDDT